MSRGSLRRRDQPQGSLKFENLSREIVCHGVVRFVQIEFGNRQVICKLSVNLLQVLVIGFDSSLDTQFFILFGVFPHKKFCICDCLFHALFFAYYYQ
jgi:hypothetical protein